MKLILGLSAVVLATALKLQTGESPAAVVFDTKKSQEAYLAHAADM
jgi:anti-sigma-K factor RskA